MLILVVKGDDTMSNRIRELRQDKKMTLKELGEAIGLAPNTISQYENGIREPKLKTWQKLADYFDVSIGYLQGVSSDDTEKEIIEKYQKRLIRDLDLIIDGVKDGAVENSMLPSRNIAPFLAGIELSKKVTEFSKKIALMPFKPMTEKELHEYIDSQLRPILKNIKNNII